MKLKQPILIRICLGLFLGWIMSLPYEGPVLYALANQYGFDGISINNATVFFHFLGLISAAFLVKNIGFAKQIMFSSSVICFLASILLIFINPNIWHFILIPISFISGTFVTSWAFFYKLWSVPKDRGKVVADVLIYANIALTLADIFSKNISAYFGYIFILIVLASSILITIKLERVNKTFPNHENSNINSDHLDKGLIQPISFFYLFIFLITLTSGTMFVVVYPYFGEFEMLASIYTNIPYILGLFIMRTITTKNNKAYTLYLGMFLLGISYIEFFIFPKTVLTFFLVMTPLLFAYGVFDYFWWRIMGDLFDYADSPSRIFGSGLAINVFGVWCGGLMGLHIMEKSKGEHFMVAMFSIGILFVIFLILPILNHQMSKLLSNHAFFKFFSTLPVTKQDTVIQSFTPTSELSEREKEIVSYVLKGFTYKEIANELYISENTIKTHSRNIYKKLGITSKYQLIQLFNSNAEVSASEEKRALN